MEIEGVHMDSFNPCSNGSTTRDRLGLRRLRQLNGRVSILVLMEVLRENFRRNLRAEWTNLFQSLF